MALACVCGAEGTQLQLGLVTSRRATEIFRQLHASQQEAYDAELRTAMDLEWGLLLGLDRAGESVEVHHPITTLPRSTLATTRPAIYAHLREAVLEPV